MRNRILIWFFITVLQSLIFTFLAPTVLAIENWQQDSVPTSILDYGKLGKILKKQNLVKTVLNPRTLSRAVITNGPGFQWDSRSRKAKK